MNVVWVWYQFCSFIFFIVIELEVNQVKYFCGITSLDSLRSLQLASISYLIFISSIVVFDALSCQREERNGAMRNQQPLEHFCTENLQLLKDF